MTPSRWPYFAQFAISAFLLFTAVLELFDTAIEEVMGIEVSTAHGLFVFAVAKLLKEGIELRGQFSETREKLTEARAEG